jgi:hypothetical protein
LFGCSGLMAALKSAMVVSLRLFVRDYLRSTLAD